MENTFNINGLMFWSADEIRLRRHFEQFLEHGVEAALLETNPAWRMHQIEAPLLTPRDLLNINYTQSDIWLQQNFEEGRDLALRPETTPGSYEYAAHLLRSHSGVKPPFVIWQAGKSFRREQDQVSKNMRLKEFYQQEFQCIYTADTANDYHTALLEPVRRLITDLLCMPTRIVESDRLPSYSEITSDVEVNNGDKWMEVCSVSRRTDFPAKAQFSTKSGMVEKDLKVVEIAIGLDRLIYNWSRAREDYF